MQSKVFDFQTANVPVDEIKECETLSHSSSLHSVPPGGAACGKIKVEESREIVELDVANNALASEDRNNPESTNLMDVAEVQRSIFLSSVIFPLSPPLLSPPLPLFLLSAFCFPSLSAFLVFHC